MIANRYVTLSALRRGTVLASLLAVFVALWLSFQPTAEGRLTDDILPDIVELTAPVDFAVSAAEDDTDTAFREDEAGFSAYYRFTDQQGNPVALDVYGITSSLLLTPDEDNNIRGQSAGRAVDIGANFGIVTLPMVAAAGVAIPPQDVTVYYDDMGWVAAYLAPDQPSAAIWKHDTTDEQTAEQELGNNLLVLAINEVITAHNEALPDADSLAWVTHDGDDHGNYRVKYYDWQHTTCNAFVLFSAKSNGGSSDPVNFVIPHTIETETIHASAAALITRQQAEGASTTAQVMVDDAAQAMTWAPDLLHVASFTLGRDDGKTSLHSVSVHVTEGESAAGAVMLLYKRPN